MFQVNDIVRATHNTKKCNIWRIKKFEGIEYLTNQRIFILEQLYSPGTSRKRTIRVTEGCCHAVTKKEVADEIAMLQNNMQNLQNIHALL